MILEGIDYPKGYEKRIKKELSELPKKIMEDAVIDFKRIKRGKDPYDFKPMSIIGTGVKEIRLKEKSGAYRIIYTANFADKIYILHSFQKKTEQTDKRNIDLARKRFKAISA
ncbi:toxin HigB-like (plasmid) [Zymomonas mobilis subsp. mobilis ZM4 = ATCC 31821]|uniref:type II toxin-antitoxin system RelE/ParE family toxin n=1 Tax=Zymomonas mobilis TaxID=542 RepID=UPI0009BCE781|nr:type II toxin-antitoxin system RelE/ParE family toxin [Zymomonas mobilis]AVZ26887.1 toxin HigB-like [Zymomonas mobilis subsp. mobilis]AVZ28807.1 toxin HigB-like [Zymomonas mobilis subsp. mobilis]AVZ43219.1 toxin HigB-like [Zymomonas mobilis subsp. mobilis ZM4 = ATCC 31821]UBQ08699.1 type II toxin-antitoxin system RelE/ParE family toxin [Zymomonas mobilis]